MGKTSSEVKNRYNKKAYDFITITVKKGEKENIKAAAEKQGKSLNKYITDLIKKDMEE
jgi:predicted HicB family RNase H-like nuclease